MADCYLEILRASPDWELHRAAGKGCFDVDLAIRIADEDDVSVPMFNGAVRGAVEMLSALADTNAPARCIYDNLDQGSALVMVLTCAPTSLHSTVESAVSARPILTVFFCSVKRRFSAPATILHAAARSLGQAWPKATGEAGAQRA